MTAKSGDGLAKDKPLFVTSASDYGESYANHLLPPMKRILIALVCLCLCACQPAHSQAPPAPPKPPKIEVHFSPRGGCTDAVVKELGNAKATVLVQAYSFTSAPIAKALVDAYTRE